MSKVKTRQKEILEILKNLKSPISGSDLAKKFSVSRQVIVQDIAVLKAENYKIISTNRGYKLEENEGFKAIIKVRHSDKDIKNELETIVDFGGEIVDVFIYHKVYGKIKADLNIRSRRDIKIFLENLRRGVSQPLKNLTSDYHYHTIKAENKEILKELIKELEKKSYLIRE